MTTTPVVRALGDLAHGSVHVGAAVCVCAPPQVLADRPDGTVVRSGHVVAKAHAPDTETPALAARLSLAASPAWRASCSSRSPPPTGRTRAPRAAS